MEPQKPFACTILDCGMAFTNEDHLHVHTKKHDMSLQLGSEQKGNFVADQTPTPTRFIRNCEEVGLFQELQNVNPFDEGFKRAMETKAGILSLDGAMSCSDDVLHTPQMLLPTLGDSFTATNNRSDITISRSSSDESGAIREYETTTTISKRNEVTTISRIIGKQQDILDKITTTDDVSIVRHEELDSNKDIINETVSYTNNIIQIHSNVEIRKENQEIIKQNNPVALISYAEPVVKDNVITKDVMFTDNTKLQVPDKIPIMSQKSIDFVVDSLTSDPMCHSEIIDVDRDKESPLVKILKRNHENAVNKKSEEPKTVASSKRTVIKLNDVIKANSEDKNKKRKVTNEIKKKDDYEVLIKLPNKTVIRMKAIEEVPEECLVIPDETKEKLKKALINKVETKLHSEQPTIQKVEPQNLVQNWSINGGMPITSGTLYPVTIVNPNITPILLTNTLQKIPIPLENTFNTKPEQYYRKTVKRKERQVNNLEEMNIIKIIDKSENSTKVNRSVDNRKNNLNMERTVGESSNSGIQFVNRSQNKMYEEKSMFSKNFLESRSAASRRYRERLKRTMASQKQENQQLKENNQRLQQENAALKLLLIEHCKRCADADDLKNLTSISRSKIQDL